MRRGTSYRGRSRQAGLFESTWLFVQENRTAVTLYALFIVGVALGVWVVRGLEDGVVQALLSLLSGFMEARQTQGFGETLMSSLTQNLILLGLLFFCGFCAISAPVIYMVPLFKGLGYGLTTGAMLAFYGSSAMPMVAFLMLPNTLLSTLVLVLACCESLRMNRHFLSVIYPIEIPRGETLPTPVNYLVKYLFFVFAIVGGSMLESYLFVFGAGVFGL